MTANDPLTCGFLKIRVYNLLVRDSHKLGKNNSSTFDKSYIYQFHCQEVKDYFDGIESFNIKPAFYAKYLVSIKKILFEDDILNIFSEKTWEVSTM